MIRRTPTINTRGIYELNTPWSADPTKVYVCHAIRTFKDIEEQGLNPFTLFYEPMGLLESDYNADVDAGASIVTLIHEGGDEIIYVPDTYIASFPDMGEVKYQHVVLSVDLGALPEYVEFDFLVDSIQTMSKEITGVGDAEVNVHVAPTFGTITPSEHETLEASRALNRVVKDTYYAQLLHQQQLNAALNQRIVALEQYIIDSQTTT